ncbi:MAG: YraN family protein [Pseudomonadota bacterium]
MSGTLSYHAGLTAEDAVAAAYTRRGLRLVARRWRGQGGEIDLVFADIAAATVFVEVKYARTLSQAAGRVSLRQAARITAAAAEYLDGHGGQNQSARIDVALVDAAGRVEIIENALM